MTEIALSTVTLNLTSVRVKCGKVTFGNKFSSSLKMFLVIKETKSSLVSIINILKIINACQDSVKRGKNCTDEWFYFLCGVIMLWVKLC